MKRYFLSFVIIMLTVSNVHGTTIYVNANVQGGNNDGTTWPHAFASLQDALSIANYGDTIWVAAGTYFPTATTNRHFSFNLKNGIKMFGGFVGNETVLSQRDWDVNHTMLSGDIGVPGDSTDNSYTVVYSNYADSTTILDGFFVTLGNANSQVQFEPITGRTKSGGGMYMVSNAVLGESQPILRNCTFHKNHAVNYGGGIFMRSNSMGTVTPSIRNCIFTENKAAVGGGIYKDGSSQSTVLHIKDCLFEHNSATLGGSLYYTTTFGNYGLYVENSSFESNESIEGGAFSFTNEGGPVVGMVFSRCLFMANNGLHITASSSLFQNDSIRFDSCSFIANNDRTIEFNRLELAFSKCTFADVETQKKMLTIGSCNVLFENSVVKNIYTTDAGGHILLVNANLTLLNCSFVNNQFEDINEEKIGIINSDYYSSLYCINSIFHGNSLNANETLFYGRMDVFSSNSLFDVADCHSIQSGSQPADTATCGPGMLYNLDPLFLDTAAGDYRLHPCSPARNAGSNAIVGSLGILTDIAGNPRIQGGTVDMGAYESPAFEATNVTVATPACGPTGTGTAALTLENGCPPFFLDWATGSAISDSSLAFINLSVGTHTVTVTDGRMEADTVSVTISAAPAVTANATSSPVNCAMGTGGTASVEAVGGTGAFSFAWNNGDSTASINGLAEGTYLVIVTDANGCTAVDSVSVAVEGSLQLGISVSPITCPGDADGSATVQPIGGAAPFTWLWQSGEDTPTIDSLSGGSYSATVTDANGCTGDIDFTMTPPPAIGIGILASDAPCFGQDGSATATPSGGTPGYDYLWSNGSTSSTTMLPTGLHGVTVTDSKGCTAVGSVTISEPPQLLANLFVQPPVLCYGASNGTITVTPSGGTPPYGWGGPFENLPAGTYAITLTDSNGCIAMTSVTIAEHPEITVADSVADASSPTASDGAIVLTSVQGGTGGGYAFLWSNGENSQNRANLPTGDYTVTVTDSQGCTGTFAFFVDFGSAAGEVANLFGASIVPNPSGGSGAKLVLGQPMPNLKIRVVDQSGRVLTSGLANGKAFSLPNGLGPGTYRVVIENRAGRAVLTWVIVY